MEEMKKGIISEEALDKAAGGLNVDKSTLKKALIAAGILGAASFTAGGVSALVLAHKDGKLSKEFATALAKERLDREQESLREEVRKELIRQLGLWEDDYVSPSDNK